MAYPDNEPLRHLRSKADQPLGWIDYCILLSLLPIAFGLAAAFSAIFGPH